MERRREIERSGHRGGSKVLRSAAIALGSFLSFVSEAAADSAAVSIAGRYDARVAHVETIGTLFSEKQDVGSGSGILIGDNLVITNNHVIPPENNYKRLDILVRLKSRLVNPISARVVNRDPQRDLVLLELAKPAANASGNRCPMPVLTNRMQAPVGTSIYVLGFPLNQDLSLSGGIISNQSSQNGRWQTDTVMNPGNSGGPVFEEHGSFVGIAVAGIVKWSYGGESHNVSGVNFFIPASEIVASPLYSTIHGLAPDRSCWIETQAALTMFNFDATGPIKINRTYTVSETKDDHPVLFDAHSSTYEKKFEAEPGYRIVDCKWHAESANHASDITCNIAANRETVIFAFRLESGPQIDRWRGWWAGTITVEQETLQ